MKKIKSKLVWAFLLMIWAFLVVIGHADAEEIDETQLYAQAAVLMDADSGRVLYGKNEDEVLAMASTTKIMTCIIALENAQPEEMVDISSYAAGMPAVKLGVRKGEQYQLQDLLYSLMLESHNDVAVAIAEHVGKQLILDEPKKWSVSEEMLSKCAADYTAEESKQAVAAFAELMNQKAKELGCENTWFITPNGLDAEEAVQTEGGETQEKFHSTTAKELALIMSYCVLGSPKSDVFLEITQTPTHTFSSENGRSFACYNHNAFLNMMPDTISGKTGFTNRAGYCYVGALENDGRTFIVALLACGWPNNKNYKWSDTRKLMEYGMDNYYYRSFLDEGTVFDRKWLEPVKVINGQTDVLGEQAYIQLKVAEPDADDCEEMSGLLMKAGEEIVVEYSQKDILTAPVEADTPVGEVRYIVDDIIYRTEEIVTAGCVEEIDWQWCLEQIFGRYFRYD